MQIGIVVLVILDNISLDNYFDINVTIRFDLVIIRNVDGSICINCSMEIENVSYEAFGIIFLCT